MKMSTKLAKRCFFFGIIWITLFSSLAFTLDWGIRAKSIEDLEEQVEQARLAYKDKPGNIARLNRLGLLCMWSGKYREAERLLEESLSQEETGIEARLIRAELFKRQYRFEEWEKELKRAADLEPGNRRVILMLAEMAARRHDFTLAAGLYGKLLQKNSNDIDALTGKASMLFRQNRVTESEDYIKKILKLDANHPAAHGLYARIYRNEMKNREWKREVRAAMQNGAVDSAIRAAMGNMLIKGEGNLKEGVAHLMAALRLDPFCKTANGLLGWGYRLEDYSRFDSEPKPGKKSVEQTKNAEELLSVGKYTEADKLFSRVLKDAPGYIPALAGKGASLYHLGHYRESMGWSLNLLERAPGYGLAYYCIQMNCKRLEDRFRSGHRETETAFRRMNAPEPPFLKDVFINYSSCDPELQKIIRLTVAPVSKFLEPMKISGATVYFMDMHQFLWQCPYLENTRGNRTFDMRLWDDVKGSGGFHLASHKEETRGVKYQGFNIFAHEFAHLVHRFLSAEQTETIRRMYLDAKKEGRILDWYAAMNDFEYFAQGLEAYVSPTKALEQKGVAGHTRTELKEKDPALFDFLSRLNRLSSYDENMVMAFHLKAEAGVPGIEDKIKALQEGLEKVGPNPLLLNDLGRIYSHLKDFQKAEAFHRQAIEEFPAEPDGYIRLANIYARFKKDPVRAVKFLENHEAANTGSYRYYFRLGELYMETGNWKKMEMALRKGIKLNPIPNIYNLETGEPYFLLAQACIRRSDYKEAEKLLLFSLRQLNRNNADGWAALALVCFKTGRPGQGKRHLEQALALNPKGALAEKVQKEFGK